MAFQVYETNVKETEVIIAGIHFSGWFHNSIIYAHSTFLTRLCSNISSFKIAGAPQIFIYPHTIEPKTALNIKQK
jgi:hypothetical protein